MLGLNEMFREVNKKYTNEIECFYYDVFQVDFSSFLHSSWSIYHKIMYLEMASRRTIWSPNDWLFLKNYRHYYLLLISIFLMR